MMELHEFPTFRQHVRDFLVQSNSFADQNNADLFTEEVAAQVGGWGARCGACMRVVGEGVLGGWLAVQEGWSRRLVGKQFAA
jgi:hypothetical protein